MARKPTSKPAGKPKPAAIAGTLTKADIPQLAGGKGANKPQMASSTYRLAALDQEYLLGDSMRGVRFMLEYNKAEEALDRWGVRSTIVVFGSARFSEKGPPDHRRWYNDARTFARIVSEKGGGKLQNGGPLPCFEPMIAGDLAVVFIDLAIPVFPGVELAGGTANIDWGQPGEDGLGGCFGAIGPVTDVFHHLVACVMGNPTSVQSSPSSFFDLTFSSSSSAITSFLVASLASSCWMRWA